LLKPDGSGGYFVRRWRGGVAWRTLFWRDMIAFGTLLNVVASFGALMLAALGSPGAAVVALHFAPLPYNAFLFAALWRLPQRPAIVAVAATLWLVVMTVV